MQICYIPSNATIRPADSSFTTSLASVAIIATDKKMNWIEDAISNAIQNTIVDPFQNWCHDLWVGFVDVSLPACIMISLAALTLSLLGVKKAQKWVMIPIVIYLFIQLFNFMM